MLIYDNEYETKENKNWTKDKIELQHLPLWRLDVQKHACDVVYIQCLIVEVVNDKCLRETELLLYQDLRKKITDLAGKLVKQLASLCISWYAPELETSSDDYCSADCVLKGQSRQFLVSLWKAKRHILSMEA